MAPLGAQFRGLIIGPIKRYIKGIIIDPHYRALLKIFFNSK